MTKFGLEDMTNKGYWLSFRNDAHPGGLWRSKGDAFTCTASECAMMLTFIKESCKGNKRDEIWASRLVIRAI